jgi:hypothetical protein
MSAPFADTGQLPVVPAVVPKVLVPGSRREAVSGRLARRRARRQRRLLAGGSVALLAMLAVLTALVIGVVR